MFSKNKKILFIFVLSALPFLGLQCTRSSTPLPKITLTYWRVFDSDAGFQKIINDYHALHPNVTIQYRQLNYNTYEQDLLNAWAEDRGPDIFSIHNTWIGKYQNKIFPLPKTTSLPIQYKTTGLGSEVVTETQTKSTITPDQIQEQFVDVVSKDVVRPDAKNQTQIWGLPLSVDTLVMYYNKDLLNRANIAVVPDDWKKFVDDVSQISKVDDNNTIVISGAALGTANSIPRFSDILSTLMMQNGAIMADANGFPTFQNVPPNYPNRSSSPGIEALKFYTDFANPGKQSYSWSDKIPDAREAFVQGQVGFFFGYAYDFPTIKARATQFGWGLAPIPQVDAQNNRQNFANYWIETVSKKSAHQGQAWDFVQFAASAKEVPNFLSTTGKPTALRALIDTQRQDPVMKNFADELLTAKSWYKGYDAGAAEQALADLVNGAIPAINTTEKNAFAALINSAVQRISATIRRPNAP